MIQGLHHTGLVVRDLSKSIAFYRDVVGLIVIREFERTGEAISQLLGYENVHLSAALLDLGEGHALELIQYIHPSPDERPSEERNVLGASHLAFQVVDIHASFRKLADGGARVLNQPVEIAPGRIACYLQDPDGNWLELLQLTD